MKVTKGKSRQDSQGKWWMEVCLGAGPSAMLHAPIGAVLGLSGIEDEAKPPAQTIAAVGTAPPSWAPNTIQAAPPGAQQVRRLAADPVFQDWAVKVSGADYNKIPDSEQFTLAFILNACKAKLPADFADEAVIDRMVELELAFEQRRLVIQGG